MNEAEFVNAEIAVWGEDYVYDLIDRGYAPVLTTIGWKWLYVSNEDFVKRNHKLDDIFVA